MSSADLSVEIYRLVTRASGGEPIDVAQRSEELAARYAHLGLSAQLIGKAISRAAGMVGISLEGAGEKVPPPAADPSGLETGTSEGVNGFHANGAAMKSAEAAAEPAHGAALRRLFIPE